MLQVANPLAQCQLKFASNGAEADGTFEGYASVFNSDDKVGDTMLPGTFAKSIERHLAGEKIKGYYNHDHSDIPVIDWVEMAEDSHGLRVKGVIDLNHHYGPSLHSATKRGAVDAMSIGFTAKSQDYENKFEGDPWGPRIYNNLDLMEISLVNHPCEPKAVVTGVKSLELLTSMKDAEQFLRDAGLSRQAAKAFLRRVIDLNPREAGESDDEKQALSDLAGELAEAVGRRTKLFGA